MTTLKDMLSWQYGLVAVSLDTYEPIHYVLYPDKPTLNDIKSLREELETDEELGLIGKNYVVLPARDEDIEFMHEICGKLEKE